MTLGNGLTITNEFDQLYRLTDSRAGNLYNRTYGYYSTGNIKTITDNLEPAGSQSFIYNELGRLTNAVGKYGELSYQYDPVGNRLSSTAGEQTTTYGYKPESNRLTSFSTNNETTNYSYDDGGNLLSKGEQSLSWSPDNRLLSVAQQDQTLGEYGYDARGLRTIRTTAEQTTMTLYDQAGNMLVETDEEGNIQREFAYLDGQRITLFDYTMNPEVYVEVYTSTGVKQSEVPIYGFDDQNQYTGLHAETDENGIAIFQRADFGEGSFTFRVDYLSG
ncbi:MAG: hypothetical protein OEM02_15695, partial [Desulfobulbaceae bacterium]|nr:hypothetical protein [Desulfobulbaceae bacterium]